MRKWMTGLMPGVVAGLVVTGAAAPALAQKDVSQKLINAKSRLE